MKIPISLAEDYVSDWGLAEAIRELIQNALDVGDYSITTPSPTSIRIVSRGRVIDNDYLLMGNGDKRVGDGNIGGFNEGLKLALLILAREGCTVDFINGDDRWTPTIEYGDYFSCKHLHINIENSGEDWEEQLSVKITLTDLPEEVILQVKENTLQMQEELGEVHETRFGRILLAPKFKGSIFCGGLFVSKFGDAEFGYDFKPQHLPLDRDRKTVRTFDCQWQTKQMWEEVNRKDVTEVASNALVQALHSDKKDVMYFSCSGEKVSEDVSEKAFQIYKEKYDGKVLAEDYEEKQKLEASGFKNVEYVGKPAFVRVVKQSKGYQTINKKVVLKTPVELLDDFREGWYDCFTTEMLDAFDNLKGNIDKIT